ncbi:metal-dependent hydrolase [Halobacterium salinarum]|jgi:hypothetical protein|uniref:metal-dependent hydrolase n=1 Tax=Halobacterium salinarum TaxID=2242 RepID=UPI00255496B4|nr:metal-dependent hydrolase [Halobacterium salinarum]MDL0138004.1 metal-dependent hydrolase [Halobacterium salinarum]
MWPWGHLAIGYLCYIAWTYVRDIDQRPLAVVAVVFGSQFPDLIDKPLAWTVPVLPSGRSLAHSLLTAGGILAACYYVSQRFNRTDVCAAFGIGYLTHIFGDLGPRVIGGLLTGDFTQLQWATYLLWPLLPAPPYPNDDSFLAHFTAFTIDPFVAAQLGLFAIAVLVWLWTRTTRSPSLWTRFR